MRLVNPFPYPVDVPALRIENLGAGQATPEIESPEIAESLLEQGWTELNPKAVVGEHGPESVNLPAGAKVTKKEAK